MTAATRLPRYGTAVAGLAVLAFLLRLGAGLAQHAIVPEYAAYYATVAEQVAAGHGLTVPYAWSYLTPAVANGIALPRPAFDVWLPAASLVSVPLVWPFGGVLAARLAGALAGAALVPLVAMLARRTALATRHGWRDADVVALLAATLVAITQPLVTGSISSDSQALFGVTVLGGVLACEWALRTGRPRDLVLAGLVLGAGMLTRNETLYLLAAVVVVALVASPGRRGERVARAALLATVAAACYAPWAVRQWLVFGTPFPGQTAANAFSVSPNDIFGWAAPAPSLATYLAAGPGALVDQRLAALQHNLVDVLVVPALPWSIVGLVGAILLWRARPLRLLIATAVLTFLADTLVYPVATQYGTFLHGSAPVLALLAIGMAELAVRAARWAMRYSAGAELAALSGGVVVVWCLLGTSFGAADYAAWANGVPTRYAALGDALDAAIAPNTVVIATHPSWVWRETGYPSVVLPDESAASVLSLAAAYHASVVVVDGVDGPWPDAAATTACLKPLGLPAEADGITAFEVVCTGP
ncbi:MAG TPA: glycosyltransferase family 39 protein [Candidatus Limnocylindrales bacterium]